MTCDKARDLIDNYHPPALPDAVAEELRSIVNDTEKELGLPLSKD
jgi:hypothetical protein